MSYYEEEFSEENLKDYALTCVELALDLPKKKFDTLIIPSRGAVPVFIGTLNALYELGKEEDLEKDFLKRLDLPATIQKLAHLPIKYSPKADISAVMMPFTADIDVDEGTIEKILEKEAPKLLKVDPKDRGAVQKRARKKAEIRNDIIDGTHRFWTRVTSTLDKPNVYQSYYFKLIHDIESDSSDLRDFKLKRAPINMAFIDTAVSGRTVSTILQEFDRQGKDVYSFIVTDANGEKLLNKCKQYFSTKEEQQLLRLYKMKKIFTENTGSSLEGVMGVVYPSLISETQSFDKADENIKFIPGTWHPVSKTYHGRGAVFNKFMETLRYALKYELKHRKEDKEILHDRFTSSQNELIELLKSEEVLKTEPKELPCDINPDFKIAEGRKISRSGVVHVYFKEVPYYPYQKK